MSSEEGIVIRIDGIAGPTAWVKTTRSSACDSCSARGSCSSESGGKVMEIKAFNQVGARVGDRVLVSIRTSSLLKVSFLAYVFPILCMIAGALIGQQLAFALGHDDPSGLAALLAFAFLGGAVLTIRHKGRAMGRKNEYVPKIIKVLKAAPDNVGGAGPHVAIHSQDPPAG